MNLLVLAIFGKYCICNILYGHSEIVTILSKYFGALWACNYLNINLTLIMNIIEYYKWHTYTIIVYLYHYILFFYNYTIQYKYFCFLSHITFLKFRAIFHSTFCDRWWRWHVKSFSIGSIGCTAAVRPYRIQVYISVDTTFFGEVIRQPVRTALGFWVGQRGQSNLWTASQTGTIDKRES